MYNVLYRLEMSATPHDIPNKLVSADHRARMPRVMARCHAPPTGMTKLSNMGARFSRHSPCKSPFQRLKSTPNYVTLSNMIVMGSRARFNPSLKSARRGCGRQKRCALLFHMTETRISVGSSPPLGTPSEPAFSFLLCTQRKAPLDCMQGKRFICRSIRSRARDGQKQASRFRPNARHVPMSGASPLGAASHDEETVQVRPQLRLVPDTLETLLTRVVANLRSSSPDTATAHSDFGSACRRDAMAVIEAGHAAGLLQTHRGSPTRRG